MNAFQRPIIIDWRTQAIFQRAGGSERRVLFGRWGRSMYTSANNQSGNLRRYFAGLAEFAFETRLGLADPPLVEYLGDLLTRFVRSDSVFAVRNLRGQRVDAVADMLSEAQARVGDAKREVHRHIGDFTLFWTGLYPEALEHFQRGPRKDFFLDYCEQGKRAYYIASTIPTSDDKLPENALFERLSHEFELCVYGLGEVRREWQRRDQDGEGPVNPIIVGE